MLALYDSDDNQLRKNKGLDQTVLYDSLLRRFIERERMKAEDFHTLKKKERDEIIEKDMERLGVAAIGMFNRRSLHIRASQLNTDLSFFDLTRDFQQSQGRTLSQADLLLGSFFFVHESKSAHKGETPQERDVDSAFEFLHNTFGEFLTADFIFRKILAETQSIYNLRQVEELEAVLKARLKDPNGLPEAWFVSLMYTPLYSRPVILDMMREWGKHRIKATKRSVEEFIVDFDTLVSHQIKRLLTSNNLPSIMTEINKTSFDDLPLIGHLAIYSMNLVLLRTVLSPNGYIFQENIILPHEDGTRAWDRLTHLWRSWFSLESLNGLTAILTAKREDKQIHLKGKDVFSISSSSDRLNAVLNVSLALADNITSGLTGLLSHDSYRSNIIELEEIENLLNSENLHLNLEITLKKLKGWRGKIRFINRREILDNYFDLSNPIDWYKPEGMLELIRLLRACLQT